MASTTLQEPTSMFHEEDEYDYNEDPPPFEEIHYDNGYTPRASSNPATDIPSREDDDDFESDFTRTGSRDDLEATTQTFTPVKPIEVDSKLVTWDGPDDPENPLNWPMWRKWAIVVSTGFLSLGVTFGSSVYSSTVLVLSEKFKVSTEVMLLGLSLYVGGFGFGGLLFGPLSEVYGRTRPMFGGMIAFFGFIVGTAVAQNLQTIFICRFFAGFFGAAPITIVGGLYVDMMRGVDLGIAGAAFTAAVMGGPALGPVVGSFITYSYLGWRWTAYITLIMSVFFTAICFAVTPETYEPTVLQWRAQRRRFETKDWALHSKSEETPVDMHALMTKYFSRPLVMIVKEPILILLTVYMGFGFAILYLTFEAYPISFEGVRHWSHQDAALPFLSIFVGTILCCIFVVVFTKTWYMKQFKRAGKMVPEHRIPIVIVGGILLPAGLFWFAWTSHPGTPWPAQVVSGIFIGAGMVLVLQGCMIYMIDVYLINANSAIAINNFLRYLAGASSPMFATYMYNSLGVDWATSLLGFVAIALLPFPFIFFVYGRQIRSWSKYAFVV